MKQGPATFITYADIDTGWIKVEDAIEISVIFTADGVYDTCPIGTVIDEYTRDAAREAVKAFLECIDGMDSIELRGLVKILREELAERLESKKMGENV